VSEKQAPNQGTDIKNTGPESTIDKVSFGTATKEPKEEPKVTETQQQAMDKGWRPKEQYEGDPDQWVDAGEFMRRGELLDRISSQSRQLRQMEEKVGKFEKTFISMAEQQQQLAEQKYQEAYENLKNKKVEALDAMDNKAVVEVEEKMKQLEQTRAEATQEPDTNSQESNTQQAPQVDPIVDEWTKRNTWYTQDVIMQGAADAIAAQYVQQNPGSETDATAVLNYVESRMKQEFPGKFGTQHRPSATTEPSNTGRTVSSKGGKYTMKDVPDHLKSVVKSMTEDGDISVHEYVEQLIEIGALD